ncbi:CaiB/BaiF CoA transferase family protein, partial [Ilumatobacter sp.]|uniref:CaiB/BaiF CoA transferase family protein n=1 Tax=Ilumatobacter sp. TaxID=1967498 RepID=UPI003AF94435
MDAPLEGLMVADFTRVLSGPHCTRMLADLGADVIKIEPPAGDVTRFSAPRRNSMPSYYAQQNAGKRSVSINLSRAEGAELAMQICERADILVENFRPGVMDRFGLGYDAVAGRNPAIIYASITGYGTTGPWKDRRAYAPVVQAETGLTKSQGDHGRAGVYRTDRHSHADLYTSLDAAAGVLAALYQRERTGRGQSIDIAMAQVMLYVNEHVHDELWDDDVDADWVRSFGNAGQPVVTVANGDAVAIAGHPAAKGNFEMYIGLIGKPELADDPKFATVADRQAHLDDLQAYIGDYAATVPDAETLEAQCARFKLAVGAVRSVRDVCDSDWARERDVVASVDDRGGGHLRIPNAPWKFSDAPGVGVSGSPRYRGEDNAEVLQELLG